MTEKEKLKDSPAWRKWGPYLSERQWATIREDYSANGDAWNYTTHETARSKAFRWGEEGIGGVSDDQQYVCLALSMWNGKDPFLKERLFGLTNPEGNHGEDVKELYWYTDNVPSHSYMKMTYRYPQQEFPYEMLRQVNRQRSAHEPEFEIEDTGIFEADKYFDVEIECAKNDATDLLIRYTVHNKSSEEAALHLLPTVWYRKLSDWSDEKKRPSVSLTNKNELLLETKHIGDYYLYASGSPQFLFTENETNNEKLFNAPNKTIHVKDGINEFVVNGNSNAVNNDNSGTKAAAYYLLNIPAGKSEQVCVRLSRKKQSDPFAVADEVINREKKNADEFYQDSTAENNAAGQQIRRQAFAGMLWNKQFYYFNVNTWLKGDEGEPPPPASHSTIRNTDWKHLMAR